jgi:hypothetical protein
LVSVLSIEVDNFLQEQATEATEQKEEERKKPEPEEQEAMPFYLLRPVGSPLLLLPFLIGG